MSNARLYRFWGDLSDALKTGEPQNEIKHTGKPMFEELYSDPDRLEQFMHAMTGISRRALGLFRPDLMLIGATDLLGLVAIVLIGWLLIFDSRPPPAARSAASCAHPSSQHRDLDA